MALRSIQPPVVLKWHGGTSGFKGSGTSYSNSPEHIGNLPDADGDRTISLWVTSPPHAGAGA
jgi:hypothetical protein